MDDEMKSKKMIREERERMRKYQKIDLRKWEKDII